MRIRFALATTFCLFAFGDIGAEEIPFGIQFQATETYYMPGSLKRLLVDSLGFNYCFVGGDTINGVTESQLSSFRDSGLAVIPGMGGSDNAPVFNAYKAYMNAHYMVMQAEEDTLWPDSSEVCFRIKNHGYRENNNMYVALDSTVNDTAVSFIFLDDLFYDHERSSLREHVMHYTPFLQMRVGISDSFNVPSGVTLAYLRVFGIDSTDEWLDLNPIVRHHRLIKEYPILSDSFINGRNPYGIEFYPPFTVPDSIARFDTAFIRIDRVGDMVLTYQIVSTGQLPFAVDSFAVYNGDGHLFNVIGFFNTTISDYVSSHRNVLSYQLRDDMPYDMMLPAKHLDQLIRTASHDTLSGMWKPFCSGFKWPYRYTDGFGGRIPIRDFFRIAQPRCFWINSYPFYGTTLYYGTSYDENTGITGLQRRILDGVTEPLDSLKAILPSGTEIWYTAQAQTEKYNGHTEYTHRRPTGPEMSMEAFIALSYGVKAIQYWPYITYTDGSKTYSGLDKYPLEGNNWLDTTESWHNVRTHVTPNLQALDEYLADPNMVWERSYNTHDQMSRADYVSSIHGWSDSYNPDSTWAQIGEFHDDSAKYIMLVNRACSKDDNGTEAPDQHFVLKLNPNAIGSNYVFITDLADSLRHAAGDTGWVGIPKTTYSARMPDGTIPYTITLKAGEGKLIKLAKISKTDILRLTDNVIISN